MNSNTTLFNLDDLSYKNDYAGIYRLTCTGNGRTYIGSSRRMYKRKKDHFGYLKSGNHYNSHLQRCYDKYGEDSVVFDVIVVLPDDDRKFLYETEQKFIDAYKPELNISKIVGIPEPSRRSVAQYDLKGNLVSVYDSLTDASDEMGVTITAIFNALSGKSRMAANHLWRYVDGIVLDSIPEINLLPDRGISEGSKWSAFWKIGEYVIHQWTKTGELVKDWTNLDDILLAYPELAPSYLREHLHGRASSCVGFVWSKNDEGFPGHSKRGTSVSIPVSLEKDGEVLNFESYTSASAYFGVSSKAVNLSMKRKGSFKGWTLIPKESVAI